MTERRLQHTIPDSMYGQRFDQVLAELFPDYSRSRLQQWLKQGLITLDGKVVRAREKVFGGETVEFQQLAALDTVPRENWQAQAIPLDIVYEDEAVIVINKPAGLVVHPGAGNLDGTLVNALLHHAPELEKLPRAGVIHRLDKDTSGLLVVARTLKARTRLVELLQQRDFEREYRAVVNGVMTAGGTVDEPIGRHPTQRVRMAVVPGGKPAVTHYRVLEKFRAHTYVRVRLETGRTHQIRVHMAYLRFPLVGDPLYGQRLVLPPRCTPQLADALRQFKRQALHAARLGFAHPESGEHVAWEVAIPDDLQSLFAALQEDTRLEGEE